MDRIIVPPISRIFASGTAEFQETDFRMSASGPRRLNETKNIAINIIVGGWHPSQTETGPVNDNFYDLMSKIGPALAGCMLSTTPTSLNAAMIGMDLRSYEALEDPNLRYYTTQPPQVLKEWFRGLLERNEMVRLAGLISGIPYLIGSVNSERGL